MVKLKLLLTMLVFISALSQQPHHRRHQKSSKLNLSKEVQPDIDTGMENSLLNTRNLKDQKTPPHSNQLSNEQSGDKQLDGEEDKEEKSSSESQPKNKGQSLPVEDGVPNNDGKLDDEAKSQPDETIEEDGDDGEADYDDGDEPTDEEADNDVPKGSKADEVDDDEVDDDEVDDDEVDNNVPKGGKADEVDDDEVDDDEVDDDVPKGGKADEVDDDEVDNNVPKGSKADEVDDDEVDDDEVDNNVPKGGKADEVDDDEATDDADIDDADDDVSIEDSTTEPAEDTIEDDEIDMSKNEKFVNSKIYLLPNQNSRNKLIFPKANFFLYKNEPNSKTIQYIAGAVLFLAGIFRCFYARVYNRVMEKKRERK